MYIVIEGQDGTGKSTQVEKMAEYLRAQGKEVLTFHEPDGDLESAHAMRDIIKQKKYDLEPISHVLLFTAARCELWNKLAVPVLKRGGIVIAARNWWSTLAYQGYAQGVSRPKIIRITKMIMPEKYVVPDKSVILILPDKERARRQAERDANGGADTTSATDTFESKPSEFQQKVNKAYEKIAHEFGIRTVDATPGIDDLFAELRKIIFKN